VLYGSDYPHNIGDMAGCLSRVDALPGAQASRVRGAAARELFGLRAPLSRSSLAPRSGERVPERSEGG